MINGYTWKDFSEKYEGGGREETPWPEFKADLQGRGFVLIQGMWSDGLPMTEHNKTEEN
jgi:hypothetical protein